MLERPPDSRTKFDDVPWQQWFTKLWKQVNQQSGSVTLASGVGTVTTPVNPSTSVLLTATNQVNPGFLSYTLGTNGFTVQSSSNTDASTVKWILVN